MATSPIPANVKAALDSYPSAARKRTMAFRKLMFEVIREIYPDDELGPIQR
jgi:hypothetical protein